MPTHAHSLCLMLKSMRMHLDSNAVAHLNTEPNLQANTHVNDFFSTSRQAHAQYRLTSALELTVCRAPTLMKLPFKRRRLLVAGDGPGCLSTTQLVALSKANTSPCTSCTHKPCCPLTGKKLRLSLSNLLKLALNTVRGELIPPLHACVCLERRSDLPPRGLW